MGIEQLQLHDGRTLEYFDSGSDRPYAVIAHHGTPSSGLPKRHEINAADQLGVRLIYPSRPGYASSTRLPGRTVASVADDMRALLDHLEIATCATYGTSGGGPHALACAALLPDRVVAAASVCGVGAYGQDDLDFLAGMGQENVDEFGAAQQGADVLRHYLGQACTALLREDVDAALATLLTPVDVEAVKVLGPELADDLAHALANGIDGWLDDDLAFIQPWGFDPDSVQVPVQIWQGNHDLMVPKAHAQWLERHLPTGELRSLDDEGHLSLPLHHSRTIMAWLKDRLRDHG